MSVVVLGGGVVGLTTATMLRRLMPHFCVTVMADQFTADTTSHGAAGIFRPSTSFSGPDIQTTRRWINDSYDYYAGLLSEPDSGVTEISGYIFSNISRKIVQNHFLEGVVKEYRDCTQEELALCPGGYKYGSYYTTLLILCSQYLPWATKRLEADGVKFIKQRVSNFAEVKGYDIIANCTGLGAEELAGDSSVVPIRGQLHKVRADWLDKFYYADFDTYIIPTGAGVATVGGSRHYESHARRVCPHDGRAILERAYDLLPRLKDGEVVDAWVGLRPHRHQVRVEPQIVEGMKVVHNYGHGGYGVTSAPGTALQAARCVQQFINRPSHL